MASVAHAASAPAMVHAGRCSSARASAQRSEGPEATRSHTAASSLSMRRKRSASPSSTSLTVLTPPRLRPFTPCTPRAYHRPAKTCEFAEESARLHARLHAVSRCNYALKALAQNRAELPRKHGSLDK